MSTPVDTASVRESLELGGDLGPGDLDRIVDHWAKLDARLRSFRSGSVRLHLTVKERDRRGQHTTLEAHVPGHVYVATSSLEDLDAALNEVRDELIRQLTDALGRAEPRRSRRSARGARPARS